MKDQFTFNNETEENSRMRYVNDNENENENKRTEEYEDSKKNIFGEKVSLKKIPQYITKEDYFNMLKTYALSHRRRRRRNVSFTYFNVFNFTLMLCFFLSPSLSLSPSHLTSYYLMLC